MITKFFCIFPRAEVKSGSAVWIGEWMDASKHSRGKAGSPAGMQGGKCSWMENITGTALWGVTRHWLAKRQSEEKKWVSYGPREFNPSGVWCDMLSARFQTAKIAAVPRVGENPCPTAQGGTTAEINAKYHHCYSMVRFLSLKFPTINGTRLSWKSLCKMSLSCDGGFLFHMALSLPPQRVWWFDPFFLRTSAHTVHGISCSNLWFTKRPETVRGPSLPHLKINLKNCLREKKWVGEIIICVELIAGEEPAEVQKEQATL